MEDILDDLLTINDVGLTLNTISHSVLSTSTAHEDPSYASTLSHNLCAAQKQFSPLVFAQNRLAFESRFANVAAYNKAVPEHPQPQLMGSSTAANWPWLCLNGLNASSSGNSLSKAFSPPGRKKVESFSGYSKEAFSKNCEKTPSSPLAFASEDEDVEKNNECKYQKTSAETIRQRSTTSSLPGSPRAFNISVSSSSPTSPDIMPQKSGSVSADLIHVTCFSIKKCDLCFANLHT